MKLGMPANTSLKKAAHLQTVIGEGAESKGVATEDPLTQPQSRASLDPGPQPIRTILSPARSKAT